MSAQERALGAFYGLAIGDALGMPTESLSRAAIEERYGPIRGFEPRAEPALPAGRVTDDTDQAVILARALVAGGGRLDHRRLADDLLAWERRMIAAGTGYLLGPSTRRALSALGEGAPLDEVGRSGTTNGAAMRIAPVGIATPPEPLERLCDRVADACALTHDTTVANAGAAAVAAAVSAGVAGASLSEATELAVAAAAEGARRGHHVAAADVGRRIGWAIELVHGAADADALDLVYELVGTGLATQDSVPAAFALASLRPDDPWEACTLAASVGGDCDTIAAMAGAIVGACCGLGQLPGDAVACVRGVNDLDLAPLVAELLALRASLTTAP